MTWLRVLVSRVRGFLGRDRLDRQLDEELQSHLDMAIEENVRRGMSAGEARRAALRRFGGVEQVKLAYRERRGLPVIEAFGQDLRYSLRTLAKTPAFTVTAIVTLAVGIGANTAIFSVINALILQPPHIAEAERVAAIWRTPKDKRSEGYVSYLELEDWRAQSQSFEAIAGYKPNAFNLLSEDKAERLPGMRVTANFLPLLKVNLHRGRDFRVEEEKRGAEPVVLVSHAFWHERLGGSETALGEKLTLNGQPFTIIGILPSGFEFPLSAKRVELITTIAAEGQNLDARGAQVLRAIGRLKEGETFTHAEAELASVAANLERHYPQQNTNVTAYLVPIDEQIVGREVRQALWVLLGAVGVLLFIACTNVTNLLLVRASVRQRELALRAAIGAGRWRIAGHLVTESLVIASVSCVAGLLMAYGGLGAIQYFGSDQLPRLDEVQIDARVLLFTVAVSVVTALLFSVLPVLQASRQDINDVMKAGAATTTSRGSLRRWRDVLVVAEVALGLVLLIGAGLMMRSFDVLVNVPPGFDPSHVLTGQISLTREVYKDTDERVLYVDGTLERLRALPGVESAAFVGPMPFSGGNVSCDFRIEGRPEPRPGDEPSASIRSVTPDYFAAIRIPLSSGRGFVEQDRRSGVGVAIVNETLVASYFPNEDPVGRFIFSIGANQNEGDPERWEIVGVVGDVRHSSLTKAATPEIYLPYQQNSWSWGNFVVRTTGEPTAVTRSFAEAIRAGDRTVPVTSIQPLTQAISATVTEARFYMVLFSLFGVMGVILMLTGIYSVISYTVSQQTHEIGIRMALGAEARDVLKLVLGRGLILSLVGIGLGLVGAVGATRLMQTLLFGVSATDPATFAGVAVALAVVALAACYFPARRAARVDPLVALKYE